MKCYKIVNLVFWGKSMDWNQKKKINPTLIEHKIDFYSFNSSSYWHFFFIQILKNFEDFDAQIHESQGNIKQFLNWHDCVWSKLLYD